MVSRGTGGFSCGYRTTDSRIRLASCQPSTLPLLASALPGGSDPAASTQHPAPSTQHPSLAAPHHRALHQCLTQPQHLTQPQLCSLSPSLGGTIPSPVGTLGGSRCLPESRKGPRWVQERAKLRALRWQEERGGDIPRVPEGDGVGAAQRGPLLHSPWCPCVLPWGRGAGGFCHRGHRAIP